ncbi:hypothetical protein HYV85_02970 [Candidatus Woesearchaeota archaeon]|nr:hypothetical protein [Candidatus Woesearchaeota archaeon]
MALRKITAKAKQLWALAVIALILSSVAAAQGSESSITAQWTCPVAPELDIGTKYYAYLESSTDVQWFKWNLPSSGKFVAELEVPPGLDYDLQVYSSCSNKACTSASGASIKEKCAVEAKAGWIYAKIYGYKGAFSKTKKYYIKGTFTASTKYDLSPKSFLIDPYSPTDKDKITIGYGVVNLGPDDIDKKVTIEPAIDGEAKPRCSKTGLKYLDYFTCYATGVSLSKGWHTLKNTVDPDNEIAETEENNNIATDTLLVTHIDYYDLTVTEIWTSPGGELNDKKTFSLNWYVKNIGSDDIKDEFESEVMIDDLPKPKCIIKELKAGNSQICTLESQKWKAGKHNVVAFADSGGKISETNDGNNKGEKNFDVTHIPETDLTVTNIYTDPASPTEKDTFSIKFDIKNIGSEAAPSGFKSNAFINGEPKGTWCYTINLGAGATETCSFDKQKWAPGSYAVRVFADAEDVIEELVETNNELEKQIEVSQYCKIKDGSAADCDCNTNKDCPSGYYCSLKAGNDACLPLKCKDECQQLGYFCGNGDAYECGNFDTDPCLETKLKQQCNLYSQKCNTAKGSCDAVASSVKLQLEDSPSHGTTVYKQPGDLIEVTIISDKLQIIEFSKPENFTLTYGICNQKTAAAPGETKCLFQISETTAAGNYSFTANEKTATVKVIDKPKAVIITNKQKLNERFSNDKEGVKALLEQAFQYASNEMDTVVYYLDREEEGHPFQNYGGYGESILSPEMTDNAYSMNTAALIAKKCGDCASIIVLGDDFVVPFYRADYAFIHSWWKWWAENKSETRYLYSDQPYIKEKKKTVGEIGSLFDRSEHKKVKIVVPDAVPSDVQGEIDKIKAAIKAFSYSDGDIKQLKSSEVGCNSYGALDEATLILVGTREDNNAIKCVPWFDIGSKPADTFKASIEVERNVWANNEYAIVVSGKDIVSGLKNLYALINNPDYFAATTLGQKDTVYIHEFSNPPELPPGLKEVGSHIVGFALGTCEQGDFAGEKGTCIATDMVAGVVPPTDVVTDIRDVVLYCPSFIWNKLTGKKGELLNGLACGGSAVGTGITIGKYVGAVTVVGAVAGEAADGGSTALKTVLKVTKSALKGEADKLIKVLDKIQLFKFDNAWKFFKATGKDGLFKNVGRFAKVTSENSKYINKLTEFFPEDALAATIKNVDDYEDVTKGTKVVMGQHLGGLNDFQKSLPSSEKLRLIKKIGKYDELIRQKGWVRHISGEPTYKGIAHIDLYRYGAESPDDVLLKGFVARGSHSNLLDHVRGHQGNFVSTAAYKSKAAEFASRDYRNGYVFEINPRALNGIDAHKSLLPLRKAGKIDDITWNEVIEKEFEISFLGSIDPQDIKGYWKVNFKGGLEEFIPNKNYLMEVFQ